MVFHHFTGIRNVSVDLKYDVLVMCMFVYGTPV